MANPKNNDFSRPQNRLDTTLIASKNLKSPVGDVAFLSNAKLHADFDIFAFSYNPEKFVIHPNTTLVKETPMVLRLPPGVRGAHIRATPNPKYPGLSVGAISQEGPKGLISVPLINSTDTPILIEQHGLIATVIAEFVKDGEKSSETVFTEVKHEEKTADTKGNFVFPTQQNPGTNKEMAANFAPAGHIVYVPTIHRSVTNITSVELVTPEKNWSIQPQATFNLCVARSFVLFPYTGVFINTEGCVLPETRDSCEPSQALYSKGVSVNWTKPEGEKERPGIVMINQTGSVVRFEKGEVVLCNVSGDFSK